MNSKAKTFFLSLFVVFYLLAVSLGFALQIKYQVVLAQDSLEVDYPKIPGTEAPTINSLPDYIKYVFNFSMLISGLVAFGVLVYGGISYLTSAGSTSAMSLAREQLTAGLLGLVILLGSYIILTTINPQLVVFNLEKEVPKPPEVEVVEPESTEEAVQTFFKIPVGAIIEDAVVNDKGQYKLANALGAAQRVEETAEELKKAAEELKKFTESCKCNDSSCSPVICLPLDYDCISISLQCNLAKKDELVNKIESTIETLKTRQENTRSARQFIGVDILLLVRAQILMTLPPDVVDYNNMLIAEYQAQRNGQEVEIETFPDWPSHVITVEGRTFADPATFYFNKDEHEEAIEFAQTFTPVNFPNPEIFTQLVQPFDATPPSIQTTTDIIDITEPFYQNIGDWSKKIIDQCRDIPNNQMWYSGCGLTSLATAINYLSPESNVTPATIADQVNTGPYQGAFDCSNSLSDDRFGSVTRNLKEVAREYNITPSENLGSFEQAVEELKVGNPVITSCSNFIGRNYSHIIVLKGVKDGYIWIHDPAGYFIKYHNGKLSPSTFSAWGCGKYYFSFEKQ